MFYNVNIYICFSFTTLSTLCFINEQPVKKFCPPNLFNQYSVYMTHEFWGSLFSSLMNSSDDSCGKALLFSRCNPHGKIEIPFGGKVSQINLDVWVLRKLQLVRNSTRVLKKKIYSMISLLYNSRGTEEKSHTAERAV